MANESFTYEIKVPGLTAALKGGGDLKSAFAGLDAEYRKLTADQGKLEQSLEDLTAAMKAGAVSAEDYADQTGAINAELAAVTKAASAARVAFAQQTAAAALANKSFASLENAADQLRQALFEVPQGTQEYNQIINELGKVQKQIVLVESDLQALEPEALVGKLKQTADGFTDFASFASRSIGEVVGNQKELEAAVTAVAIAEDAATAAKGASEAVIFAQQARRIASQKLLNAEVAVGNKLNTLAAAINNRLGASIIATTAGTNAATLAFKLLKPAILGTGIGALVVVLGAAFAAFQQGDSIIKSVTNGFKTLGAAVQGFGQSLLDIVSNPIKTFQDSLKTLGQLITGDFSGALDTFSQTWKSTGDAVNKEIQRQGAERTLLFLESAQKLLDANQAVNEALLADDEKSRQALLASQVAYLKRKEQIALSSVTVTTKLTADELKIITTGSRAQIEELTKRLKQEGKLNDDALEKLDQYAQARVAVINKEREALKAAREEEKKLNDDRIALNKARLANDNTFAGQATKLALDYQKTISDLQAAEANGEKVTQEQKLAAQLEYYAAANRLAVDAAAAQRQAREALAAQEIADVQSFAAERTRIQRDLDAQLAELADKRRKGEQIFAEDEERIRLDAAQKLTAVARQEQAALLELENERLERRTQSVERALSLEQQAFEKASAIRVLEAGEIEALRAKELAAATQVNELQQRITENRLRTLEAQQLQLDPAEYKAKYEQILREQEQATQANADRLVAIDAATQERTQANRERATALFIQDIELRTNAVRQYADFASELNARELSQQEALLTGTQGLTAAREASLRIEELATQERDRQVQLANDEAQAARERIDAELGVLRAKEQQTEEDKRRIEQLLQELQGVDLELRLKTDDAEAQLKEAVGRSKEQLAGLLKQGLEDPFNTAITSALGKLTASLDPLQKAIVQQSAALGVQLVQQSFSLFEQFQQAQIEALGAAQARTQQQLQETETRISSAQEQVNKLTEAANAEEVRGTARGNALAAQLSGEQNRLAELRKEQKALAKEEQRIAKEKAAREKDAAKQALRIQQLQAIGNAALAITNALATVPFPGSLIVSALYAGLTAVQLASIEQQRSKLGRKGGLLTAGGDLIQMRNGGVVAGPAHENGGVRGTGTFSNIVVEGGEHITSKPATARNLPLLEAINREGGVRDFAAEFGFKPAPKLRPGVADAIREAGGSDLLLGRMAAGIDALNEKEMFVSVTELERAQNERAARIARATL